MNAYLEIIRPGNAIMAIIAVILMGVIGHNYSLPLILGMAATFLALGGGNAINDVFDIKIDSINKPERPIRSGVIFCGVQSYSSRGNRSFRFIDTVYLYIENIIDCISTTK